MPVFLFIMTYILRDRLHTNKGHTNKGVFYHILVVFIPFMFLPVIFLPFIPEKAKPSLVFASGGLVNHVS